MIHQRLALLVLLASFTTRAFAGNSTVTTVADSGPGSLREALAAANSGACARPCAIDFAIPPPVPADGYFTIRPLSPLPGLAFVDQLTIDGSSQTRATGDTNPRGPEIELDGSTAGYRSGLRVARTVGFTIRDLAINRFEGHGIFVDISSQGEISWNYVGVDPTGSRALPNGFDGIAVRDGSVITLRNNVISGNRGNGLYVSGDLISHTFTIHDNRIGIGAGGEAIGNGANGIAAKTRGASIRWNQIANNAHFGVVVQEGAASVEVEWNSIFDNGLLAIGLGHDGVDPPDALDADEGANGRMNAPVLTSAHSDATLPGYAVGTLSLTGRIRAKPNTEVWIDAYASPRRNRLGLADARKWVANARVMTDANGDAEFLLHRDPASFTDAILIPGGWLSATATTDEGTSELSAPILIAAGSIEVTSLADAGDGSLREAITLANQSGCEREAPCWITFNIPAERLTNGVAVFELASPLPAIENPFVRLDGSSQTWWGGDTNPIGPEVELRGARAGEGAGLKIGTAAAKVEETFIHSLAITGFSGDGISIDATEGRSYDAFDIRLTHLFVGIDPRNGEPAGNGGDGISIRGARTGGPGTRSTIANCIIASNGGNGVRIDAAGVNVDRNYIGLGPRAEVRPNRGAGVFVGHGSDIRIAENRISFNRKAGVATANEGHWVYIDSIVSSNGLLGIDRNDDGVGSGASDLVTPRPTILSATYDPAKKVTVVEGELGEGKPSLPFPPGSGEEMQIHFFHNAIPDPSGFGEGESRLALYASYVPVVFTGRHFRAELSEDLRGRFLAATTSSALCYWEFGCHGRDTSEFSRAVEVK